MCHRHLLLFVLHLFVLILKLAYPCRRTGEYITYLTYRYAYVACNICGKQKMFCKLQPLQRISFWEKKNLPISAIWRPCPPWWSEDFDLFRISKVHIISVLYAAILFLNVRSIGILLKVDRFCGINTWANRNLKIWIFPSTLFTLGTYLLFYLFSFLFFPHTKYICTLNLSYIIYCRT